MLCPLPGACIYDEYQRTGAHFCAAVRCHHVRLLRMMLGERIQALMNREEKSEADLLELERLKREYAKTLKKEGEQNGSQGA